MLWRLPYCALFNICDVRFNNSSSTQLYRICIDLKIVISLVFSLSFGVLTLIYFYTLQVSSNSRLQKWWCRRSFCYALEVKLVNFLVFISTGHL